MDNKWTVSALLVLFAILMFILGGAIHFCTEVEKPVIVEASQKSAIMYDADKVVAAKEWEDGSATVWIAYGDELVALYVYPPLDSITTAILKGGPRDLRP